MVRYGIGDSVIYQDVQQELVLLNMETQQYFGLDDIGAEMWRMFLSGGDVESISGEIQGRYHANIETVRNDVEKLADRLVEAGLLKIEARA